MMINLILLQSTMFSNVVCCCEGLYVGKDYIIVAMVFRLHKIDYTTLNNIPGFYNTTTTISCRMVSCPRLYRIVYCILAKISESYVNKERNRKKSSLLQMYRNEMCLLGSQKLQKLQSKTPDSIVIDFC